MLHILTRIPRYSLPIRRAPYEIANQGLDAPLRQPYSRCALRIPTYLRAQSATAYNHVAPRRRKHHRRYTRRQSSPTTHRAASQSTHKSLHIPNHKYVLPPGAACPTSRKCLPYSWMTFGFVFWTSPWRKAYAYHVLKQSF
jgi:hypothetical protein